MNGIVISVNGDLTSVLNALGTVIGQPNREERRRRRDLLRNGECSEDRNVRKDRTLLAMLKSVHRDVEDARAAITGHHRPEAAERMKHMFGVVDQIENVLAEG